MSWEGLTAVGTVFTGLVIVVTAIVGVNQLRQLRAQRRDTAAVELVRSLQDDTFLRAYSNVFSLPESASATEVRAKGDACMEAAVTVGFRLEMLGVLVYRGAIPFGITEDLIGGLVVGAWRRLRDNVCEFRKEKVWPGYMEWFQWLAEQFERRDRMQKEPAHLRVANWRPRADG